jgi:hypothetical protein
MDEGSGTSVANTDGATNITLNNGGTWATNSNYEGGAAPTFDGSDDWLVSASQDDFNNSEISVCGWLFIEGQNDNDWPIFDASSTSSGSIQDDGGWSIDARVNTSTFTPRLQHLDASGSATELISFGTVSFDLSKWLFFAYAGNGDSGRLLVWEADSDGGSNLFDSSATGTRGDLGDSRLLHGMGRTDFSRHAQGTVDAWFAARGAELTKSEFETIRSKTDNGR